MKRIDALTKLSNMLPRHTLITIYKTFVTYCMINQIIKVSVKKLEVFNKMLPLPLQVPLQVHLR